MGNANQTKKQRKPWNRVPEQVYSILTRDKNGQVNMNIATYVVPVCMHPKKYLLAIYRNTKTHENIFQNKESKNIILQGLSTGQAGLVKALGKKTGLKYDKNKYLIKNNLVYQTANSLNGVLKENGFTIALEVEETILAGDHDLVLCRVVKVLENNQDKKLLDTEYLMSNKIIL